MTQRGQSRLRRLADTLTTYRASLENRRSRAKSPALEALEECVSLLDKADSALESRDVNAGWTFFLEAERVEIGALTDPEREARVVALRNEVADKLLEWRRKAAMELLENAAGRPATIDQIKEAVRIRNEHFNNQYHKLALTHDQLIVLAWALLAALAGLLLIVGFSGSTIGRLGWVDLARLMIAGALGGALSAVRSLGGRRHQKIPEQLAEWPITALRPLIGAAAGTGVALLLEAGIIQFGEEKYRDVALLAVAFLAGFSERWFLGVIGGVPQGKES